MTGEPQWGLSGASEAQTNSPASRASQPRTEAHSGSVAAIIGSVATIPEEEINLVDSQKKAICLIYRALFVDQAEVNAQAIWEQWPESINNRRGGDYYRAGPRPPINEIQSYMGTEDFAALMERLGINVNLNETGLSVEQLGLLTILTNPTDGRTLKGKLKAAGVSWPTYQAWMRQPRFHAMFKKWASTTLMDAIPAAETQLANLMASGDMSAIRFGMEVTGRHDPANKKQVDGQKLVALILEVIEEEIKDVEILRAIGNKIQLRAINALE